MATEKENLIRAYTEGIKDGADAVLDMLGENKSTEEMRNEAIAFGKGYAEEAVADIMNPRPRRSAPEPLA